jgi:hypothetical protein
MKSVMSPTEPRKMMPTPTSAGKERGETVFT